MWNEFMQLQEAVTTAYYGVMEQEEDKFIQLSNNLEEVLSSLRVWKRQQILQVD